MTSVAAGLRSGIGSGSGDCEFYLHGGNVIAQGGTHCPGISCESSYSSSGYNSINIYGGIVSARGGEYAAGIGSTKGK